MFIPEIMLIPITVVTVLQAISKKSLFKKKKYYLPLAILKSITSYFCSTMFQSL